MMKCRGLFLATRRPPARAERATRDATTTLAIFDLLHIVASEPTWRSGGRETLDLSLRQPAHYPAARPRQDQLFSLFRGNVKGDGGEVL